MKISGLGRVAVLWVGLSLAGDAGAQDAPPASEVQPAPADPHYDALISEALIEYNAQNWPEAYSLFQKAHEASPNARTLRGLGVTSFELREYPRALAELSAALRHPNRPLTAVQRAETERLMERIARLVGTLIVTLEPAGAELSIDNEPTTAREITVRVGTVTLLASAPGYQTQRRAVTVAGGQRQQVAITLSPTEERVAGAVDPVPTPPVTTAPAESSSTPAPEAEIFSVPVLAALGVSAAGLITLAIAGPLALSEESALSESCGGRCTEDQLSTLDSYTLIADVGLGVALAGGLTAGVLIALNMQDEQPQATALAPYLGRDGFGAIARGSF